MVPITSIEEDREETLKSIASQPWEENFEHIETWDRLKDEPQNIAQDLVTKFCPSVISPSLKTAEVNKHSYVKVKDGGRPQDFHSTDSTGFDGYCAYEYTSSMLDGYDVDRCAQLAKDYWPTTSMFSIRDAESRAETYACGGYWTAGSWWWFTPEWVTSWCTSWHTDVQCKVYMPHKTLDRDIFEGYVLDPETTPTCVDGRYWNDNMYWQTYALNPSWNEI